MNGLLVQHVDSSSYATSVLILHDGNFVVVGVQVDASGRSDGFIAKYTSKGQLVPSFGEGGITLFDYTEEGYGDDWAKSVSAFPDGRLLVSGYSAINGVPGYGMSLALFDANGHLDESFSDTGLLTYRGGDFFIQRAQIQSDGKIVVAGHFKANPSSPGYEAFIARMLPNGALDTSFAGDGIVTSSAMAGAPALAIQADGKIVIGGATTFSFVAERFLENGDHDLTFGTSGIAKKIFETKSSIGVGVADLALQPDGKIVIVGSVTSGTDGSNFTVARFNSNGTIDKTFSGDGVAATDFSNDADSATTVLIDAAGKILVSGYSISASENYYNDPTALFFGNVDFAVARYNADGSADATFSTDGKLLVDFGSHNDTANSAALLPSGGILLAGYSFHRPNGNTGDHLDAAVASITNSGTLNLAFASSDQVPPTVVSWSPPNGGGNIPVDANLVVVFSESISRGTGSIVLKAGGVVFGTYDVSTSPGVAISGSVLSLNPITNLGFNTTYTVEIPAGAIVDASGNTFAGAIESFTTTRQHVTGSGGSDYFIGGTSGEFDGGPGIDFIVYSARNGISGNPDGSFNVGGDTVRNIERAIFPDSKVALDVTGSALSTLQLLGVIAPAAQQNLGSRSFVLSLLDQGHSALEICQGSIDLGYMPHDEVALAQTVFQNVAGYAPSEAFTNELVNFIHANGAASLIATAASLSLNVDLVGLQHSGMEYI